MKNTIIAITSATALFSCTPVYANENLIPEFCTAISQLAEKIMEGRQNGIPAYQANAFAAKIEDSVVKPYVMAIVEMAYTQPKFNTTQYKQEAITEFGNEWYGACVQHEQKRKKTGV